MKYLLITILLLSSTLNAYQTASVYTRHGRRDIKFGCFTYVNDNGCTYFYSDDNCHRISYMVCGNYSVQFHGEQ